MGEVYIAHDARLNRKVALKILPSGSPQDATRKRRFIQEARAASSLNHPNILTIHDFGTMDGISYIVSELIEGESLRTIVKSGALPMRKLLDIAVQVADGLAAAHKAGIVHRDLKPENIMVTPGGRAKILDFGLAKPIDPSGTWDSDLSGMATCDGERTQPGLILGTVGYMSPEQARGLPVGPPSDQFSLGVILHEMATGQQPFLRETPMQTLLEIANLSEAPFTPGPVAFRLLVARLLSRDPEKRFASTAEIHERLKRISDELPDRVQFEEPEFQSQAEVPVVAAIAKRRRRLWSHPAFAALAAIAAFALGLVAARLTAPHTPADFSNYKFTPVAPVSELEALPAFSPNGRTVAYAAESNGVFQIFTQPLKSALAAPLTRAADDCLFPFWSPQGTRIYYISGNRLWSVGASGGSPELLWDNVARAAVSEDGRTFALLRDDNGGGVAYSLWFAQAGTAPRRYSGGSLRDKRFFATSYVAFAPDGKLGLWTSNWNGTSEFWVIPGINGQPRKYLGGLAREPLARMFAWMPDSARIVYGERDHLWIAVAATGARHEITTGTGRERSPALVDVGGGEIGFATPTLQYSVQQIALSGGAPVSLGEGVSPTWSPLAPVYAYITDRSGEPEIWLKDTRSGWERPVVRPKDFPDRTLFLGDLAFSPDGQRVAYRRTGAGSEAIWVSTLDGEAPVRIAEEPNGLVQRGPAWSPDGNWIAYFSVRDGRYALLKAAADGSGAPVLLRRDAGQYPAWSPAGDVIATVGASGVKLVQADGSAMRGAGDGIWFSLAWSRDGKTIYGIRRSPQRHLELATLNPRDGTEAVRVELGNTPAAFAYGVAVGANPVWGASVSADGKTFLTSLVDIKSRLWLLSGYAK